MGAGAGITPPSIAKALGTGKTPYLQRSMGRGRSNEGGGDNCATRSRGGGRVTPGDPDYLYFITQTGKKLADGHLDRDSSSSSSSSGSGGGKKGGLSLRNPKPRALEMHMPNSINAELMEEGSLGTSTFTPSHTENSPSAQGGPLDLATPNQQDTPLVDSAEALLKKNVPVWH